MTNQRALVIAVQLTALATHVGAASDRPVTVSPGHTSRFVTVGDRCPTFSWGQVPEAGRYEVVVYRVGGEGEKAPVVLRETIDARASSWTPTLERCLERGARYAWSLRARRGGDLSEWSTPSLFEVANEPDIGDLKDLLADARGLESTGAACLRRADGRGTGPATPSSDHPGSAASDATASAAAGKPSTDDGPESISLSVDGHIEAASFGGDGAGLANVHAAGLACVGCVDGGQIGDGAVTAAKIGAACASGQVLMRGPSGWDCAMLSAPACTPGDRIGCYTGPDGTLGVGECAAGSRVCAGDSTWGVCSDEILPAAAELCDGLDNTCDGPIDEGDPATLCPLTANATATLCDAAACAITGCAALWADADGDYANGCEAPSAGACIDGGVPRSIVAPGEGELVIRELLADPAPPLGDASAEWFEVAVQANVDLNGLGIGTAFGTVIDQIDDADCRPVQAGDVLLFARSADPAANGGLATDGTFGFSLVNGGGALHLAHAGNLVDAVSWAGADITAGRARNLPPGLEDAGDNDDPLNWCTVPADPTLLYADGNHGTPGQANIGCP